jgi:hypothetical protein
MHQQDELVRSHKGKFSKQLQNQKVLGTDCSHIQSNPFFFRYWGLNSEP